MFDEREFIIWASPPCPQRFSSARGGRRGDAEQLTPLDDNPPAMRLAANHWRRAAEPSRTISTLSSHVLSELREAITAAVWAGRRPDMLITADWTKVSQKKDMRRQL